MKKLFTILSLVIAASCIFGAVLLDMPYRVRWSNGGYMISDASMTGLQDTSELIALPSSFYSMDVWLVTDTGATGIAAADNDSCFLIGYLCWPGGSTANWALLGGDTLFEAEFADSGYNTSALNVRYKHYADTFFHPIIIPPPDTAGGSAALRGYGTTKTYAFKYPYLRFKTRVTDSTGMDGTELYIRFNSMPELITGAVGLNKK